MLTQEERRQQIAIIRAAPEKFEALVKGLSDEALTAHPLEGEWSVAQNIHHLADSHMNAYIRFKFILMQENPTIMPYDQDDWAATADSNSPHIASSLAILRGLHDRWTALMASLDDAQWERTGIHPEVGTITLEWILTHYVEHSQIHIDQITRTRAAHTGK